MEVETVYYIVGTALAVVAILLSFAGMRTDRISQGKMFGAVVTGLVALIAVTAVTAVMSARDEQHERREHQAKTSEGEH